MRGPAAIEAELKILRAKRKPTAVPKSDELEMQIARKEAELPPPLPTLQTVEDDPEQFVPVHVLARSDFGNPGEAVGMKTLGVPLTQVLKS